MPTTHYMATPYKMLLMLAKYLGLSLIATSAERTTLIAKANAAEAFLRRNTTFVQLRWRYTVIKHLYDHLWNVLLLPAPHTAHDMTKLEKIQCRAARYILMIAIYHSIVFLPC